MLGDAVRKGKVEVQPPSPSPPTALVAGKYQTLLAYKSCDISSETAARCWLPRFATATPRSPKPHQSRCCRPPALPYYSTPETERRPVV
nr:hypothetical protein Itr_chr08CG15090 [Ipomoea trifida]